MNAKIACKYSRLPFYFVFFICSNLFHFAFHSFDLRLFVCGISVLIFGASQIDWNENPVTPNFPAPIDTRMNKSNSQTSWTQITPFHGSKQKQKSEHVFLISEKWPLTYPVHRFWRSITHKCRACIRFQILNVEMAIHSYIEANRNALEKCQLTSVNRSHSSLCQKFRFCGQDMELTSTQYEAVFGIILPGQANGNEDIN